ncbi:MAG: hypothetical protein ABW173_08875 [Sphingomonas sp.]
MFARIDHWIGRTLFVPLIIRLCQRTGQSQYAVSRLFWFMAALDGLYHADTMVAAVLFGAVSVVMMVTAALLADRPTRSAMPFRLLAVVFLSLDLIEGAVRGQWVGVEFWMLVLVAEYASSITTIPPAETKKRAARVAKTG